MSSHKDVSVSSIDEEIIDDGLGDASGDDGRRGQDEDSGHDHQHLGQGHLT